MEQAPRSAEARGSQPAPPAPLTANPIGADDPYAFEWSFTEEPHASRRKAILAKYGPAVRALYGPDPTIKWRVALCVGLQLALAALCGGVGGIVGGMPWAAVFLLAYTVGGVVNHSLSLALHETSHSLAFKAFGNNRWFGMVANLPLGIPVFSSFKRYHLEHHRYQGEDGIDVDVPTRLGEGGGEGIRMCVVV